MPISSILRNYSTTVPTSGIDPHKAQHKGRRRRRIDIYGSKIIVIPRRSSHLFGISPLNVLLLTGKGWSLLSQVLLVRSSCLPLCPSDCSLPTHIATALTFGTQLILKRSTPYEHMFHGVLVSSSSSWTEQQRCIAGLTFLRDPLVPIILGLHGGYCPRVKPLNQMELI